MIIKELLLHGGNILQDAGIENFNIDAEILFGSVAGFDNKKLFLSRDLKVNDALCTEYLCLINRRAAGEPLQYITGEQYFMGHRFCVDPSALIPRPETEILAEKAISYLCGKHGSRKRAVLDLCTGSGAIAISIAKDCPRADITALDISEPALEIAQKNARTLGVAERIDFVQSDLFDAFEQTQTAEAQSSGVAGAAKFDLIVTNPPYIRTADMAELQREVRDFEPALALDGGADGLLFYRRIAKQVGGYLCEGGRILAEIGYDQAKDVSLLFQEAGFVRIQIFPDLSGRDRILQADVFTKEAPDTSPCPS